MLGDLTVDVRDEGGGYLRIISLGVGTASPLSVTGADTGKGMFLEHVINANYYLIVICLMFLEHIS